MPRPLLRLPLVLLGAFLLTLAGCQPDDIRSYSVKRPDDDSGSGPTRLLAAIVPAGDDAWFFKLVGRGDIIEMVEPAFTKLVDSFQVKPGADPSLTWTVPTGWKEDRTNPVRVATLTPEGVGRPEIAVSKLPAAGAALKPNVDRWRRIDLGLGPISGSALAKVSRKRKVGDVEVTLIDLRGPGVTKADAKMAPPKNTPKLAPAPPPRDGSAPLTYKTPAGWREQPSASSIVAASLAVGDPPARMLATPLRGAMPGGLLANVNRWRKEVGLDNITDDDVKTLPMRPIRIGDADGRLLELAGATDHAHVAWVQRKGTTWFFKFRGPAATVRKHKDEFTAFLQSITFTGAADE
ncbi:MAG: hypothetical protein U0736_23110 [Gemmataceae bacterium]